VYLYSAPELAKTSQQVPGGREQVHLQCTYGSVLWQLWHNVITFLRVTALNHYGQSLIFCSCHWQP